MKATLFFAYCLGLATAQMAFPISSRPAQPGLMLVISTLIATASALTDTRAQKNCYVKPTSRLLAVPYLPANLFPNVMTSGYCSLTCGNAGFLYGAVTNGKTCSCGNDADAASVTTVADFGKSCVSDCTGKDPASSISKCGGPSAIQLLTAVNNHPLPPIDGFNCFSYPSFWNRSLASQPFAYIGNGMMAMNTGYCQSWCRSAGYKFAAMHNGKDCWCGNYEDFGILNKVDQSFCNVPCIGTNTQICGGVNNVTVLTTFTNTFRDNCYVQNSTAFTVKAPMMTLIPNANTDKTCSASCGTLYYPGFAALTKGNECYCGKLSDMSKLNMAPSQTNCSTPCSGNQYNKCGGTGFMNVYPTTFNPPAPTKVNSNCYAQSYRGIAQTPFSVSNNTITPMTIDNCGKWCSSKGYQYTAMVNGNECYCGMHADLLALTAADPLKCNKVCTGNTNQKCGGYEFTNIRYYYFSVYPAPYKLSTVPLLPTVAPAKVAVDLTNKDDYAVQQMFCNSTRASWGYIRGLTATMPATPSPTDIFNYITAAVNQLRTLAKVSALVHDPCLDLYSQGTAFWQYTQLNQGNTKCTGHCGQGRLPPYKTCLPGANHTNVQGIAGFDQTLPAWSVINQALCGLMSDASHRAPFTESGYDAFGCHMDTLNSKLICDYHIKV